MEVVKGIIGYGLLLSRYGKDGATNMVSSIGFLIFGLLVTRELEAEVVVVVVVTVVLEVVEVVLVTSRVTGRSLVSMMLVEEMDELRNLDVISLTFRVLVGRLAAFTFSWSVVVVKTLVTVGLGVMGIRLLCVVLDLLPGLVVKVKSEGRKKISVRKWWFGVPRENPSFESISSGDFYSICDLASNPLAASLLASLFGNSEKRTTSSQVA